MLINLTMVVGLQAFMGNSGVASFGHVGFMLLGAYGTVLLTLTPREKSFILREMPRDWWLHELHLPFVAALLVAGVIVSIVAALIGIPLLRIGATAFGLTSFAFLVVIRIVAVSSDALTNGTRTLVGIPHLTELWMVTIFAIAFVAIAYAWKESRWGLQLRASREDLPGRSKRRHQCLPRAMVGWVISAFITAVAGGLWAFYVTIFSPVDFWVNIAFLIISMLVIGGQASVSGAVVGAIVISVTSHVLTLLQNEVNFSARQRPGFGQTDRAGPGRDPRVRRGRWFAAGAHRAASRHHGRTRDRLASSLAWLLRAEGRSGSPSAGRFWTAHCMPRP